jgi:hypothetical protein
MKRVPTPKFCAEIRAEVAQIQAARESLLRETLARLENIRAKIDRSETNETPASASAMLQPVEILAAKPPVSLSQPVVQMNQEEEKEAHEALQQHFEEDRNELRSSSRAIIISWGTGASHLQSDR